MKKISFIIPCFNEEKNVLIIYDKIKKIYQQQNYEVEIIFIDDGSSDNTLYELKQIKDSDKKIIAKTTAVFPEVNQFDVNQRFGSWDAINTQHFVDNGLFDRLYISAQRADKVNK